MAIALIVLMITACEKMLLTEGAYTEKVIPLTPGILDLRIDDVFDVELIKDTTRFVRVSGGENLLRHVCVRLEDTILSVGNESSFCWLADYQRPKLELHLDTVRNLFLGKASSLSTTVPFQIASFHLFAIADYNQVDIELDCQYFYFMTSHTTTGDFRFRGVTEFMVLCPYYASRIDALGLKATQALVINHSLADIKLHVSDILFFANYQQTSFSLAGDPVVLRREDAGFDVNLLPAEIREEQTIPVRFNLLK